MKCVVWETKTAQGCMGSSQEVPYRSNNSRVIFAPWLWYAWSLYVCATYGQLNGDPTPIGIYDIVKVPWLPSLVRALTHKSDIPADI